MLTTEELEAIEKRLEAATPGPWSVCSGPHGMPEVRDRLLVTCPLKYPEDAGQAMPRDIVASFEVGDRSTRCVDPVNIANAELCGNAPTDIAALLADLKLYKKAVEEMDLYISDGIIFWTGDVVAAVENRPALATILKGVKG